MELQQKMYKLVEEWKLSTKTKSEFSVQENITYHSFNYWIKKYNKSQNTSINNNTSDEKSLSFFSIPESENKTKKQLTGKSFSNQSKCMEIELRNGIKITIY
jgi:type II secretory pathway pseudopilin PulG